MDVDKYRDEIAGLRPAIFLSNIKLVENRFLDDLSKKGISILKPAALDDIKNHIADECDQIIAPWIAKGLYKNTKYLLGDNPHRRYHSFFIDNNGGWSDQIRSLRKEYKYIFDAIESIVNQTYACVQEAIEKIYEEKDTITKKTNGIFYFIERVFLGQSDKHNNGKVVIILSLDSGKKIVYKPKAIFLDEMLIQVINEIDLSSSYSIDLPKLIVGNKSYGIYEYVDHQSSECEKYLNSFYENAGAVLALLDALNYTDGHHENFIAGANSKFILVDSETILSNFSDVKKRTDLYFDLSFTGIIEFKNTIKNKSTKTSALQAHATVYTYPMMMYIQNDLTDKMRVRYYKKIDIGNPKSIPTKINNSLLYQDSVIKGMLEVYKRISTKSKNIIDIVADFSSVIKIRQIMRHTLYYQFLITKGYHPQTKMNDIDSYFRSNLLYWTDKIIPYETQELKNLNIPVFYSRIFSRSLFDGAGREYKDFFEHTNFYWLLKKINSLASNDFLEARVSEIKSSFK